MKNKVIGINLLFLIPGKIGGSEPYSRGIVDGLHKFDKENKYVLFCNKENYDTFDKEYNRVLIPINASNRFARLLTEQIALPLYLFFLKVDVVYSLGYTSPFITPCKSIVNIFDLNWYYHPEDFSFPQRIIWRFFITNSARFADAITTSSFSSKKSIEDIFKYKKNIEAIYPGLPQLSKIKPNARINKNNTPYFFSLSAAYPHKNLITLLKAHKILIDKGHKVNLQIAGLGGKSSKELEEYIRDNKIGNYVKQLGYVSDKKMVSLYNGAKALVFTSAYEGFGIPIIEAFSLGVPVISSNAFSLKEVVGNGGVLISPYNYKRFATEMGKVIVDDKYRKNLSLKSKKAAIRFNWQASIDKLTNFFDKTVIN
jgi:glycosyltransferase involved in cell wall biosynthesis